MVAHTCNPGTWRQRDQKFKVVLGYITSLHSAWTISEFVSLPPKKNSMIQLMLGFHPNDPIECARSLGGQHSLWLIDCLASQHSVAEVGCSPSRSCGCLGSGAHCCFLASWDRMAPHWGAGKESKFKVWQNADCLPAIKSPGMLPRLTRINCYHAPLGGFQSTCPLQNGMPIAEWLFWLNTN